MTALGLLDPRWTPSFVYSLGSSCHVATQVLSLSLYVVASNHSVIQPQSHYVVTMVTILQKGKCRRYKITQGLGWEVTLLHLPHSIDQSKSQGQ
jgi:hypothetical protein